MITPNVLKDLIGMHANLRITGSYTPNVLKDCVQLAVENNTKLTIVANNLTPNVMKDLVKLGGENLTLEI